MSSELPWLTTSEHLKTCSKSSGTGASTRPGIGGFWSLFFSSRVSSDAASLWFLMDLNSLQLLCELRPEISPVWVSEDTTGVHMCRPGGHIDSCNMSLKAAVKLQGKELLAEIHRDLIIKVAASERMLIHIKTRTTGEHRLAAELCPPPKKKSSYLHEFRWEYLTFLSFME